MQEVEEEFGLTFTQANIHIQYGGKRSEARHEFENNEEVNEAKEPAFKTLFDISIPRLVPKGFEQ